MCKIPHHRVLVIEDNVELLESIAAHLEAQGFLTLLANTGAEGMKLLHTEAPDLILLDLILPDQDGLTLCRQIREQSAVAIIILSGRSAEQDRVVGLQAGADDYLTKPFGFRELLARMEAVLRRVPPVAPRSSTDPWPRSESGSVLEVGDVRLELTTCRITIHGVVKTLTPNEFRLMAIFMHSPGEVFTREDLRQRVWPDDQHSLHLVEVHIANLRAKIEPDPHHPQYVLTVRSRGYKFATGQETVANGRKGVVS